MDYNPTITVQQYSKTNEHPSFTLLNDGVIVGGTKRRALFPYIEEIINNSPSINEFVYAGPSGGMAHVAIAYVVSILNDHLGKAIKFTAILEEKPDDEYYGANYIIKKEPLSKLQAYAYDYVNETPGIRKLLPFGLDDNRFRELLEQQLREALSNVDTDDVKRLWVVAGSALIASVLYNIFDNATIMTVQVGRTLPLSYMLLDIERIIIIQSDEPFTSDAIEQPPYDTVPNYDAKLWAFFKRHGRDGDYIFNVAAK